MSLIDFMMIIDVVWVAGMLFFGYQFAHKKGLARNCETTGDMLKLIVFIGLWPFWCLSKKIWRMY